MRVSGRVLIMVLVGLGATRGGPTSAQAPGNDGAVVPAQVGPGLDEYRSRRLALSREIREAETSSTALLVVIVGRGEPADDAKFHQTNDFHYLTGVDLPFASVISRPDLGQETLYLPPRNRWVERYTGPTLTPGPEAAKATGFARVASTSEFLADLFRGLNDPGDGRRFASASTIYVIDADPKPSATDRSAWLTRLVREGAPGVHVKELATRVHESRKTKSPAEVALIRRAIGATAEAQTAVARLAGPKATENQLEGAILNAFVANGATRAGFPSIVGSGPNSTVLHYGRNDRALGAGELVVVDIGAEVGGYTADITRTFPVDGRFTPRQREVYQLVLDAQAGAARELKPGESTIGSLNRWVRDYFRASPLRARDEEGVEHSMDHFFLHGLGHHLGLDVHDVGDESKPLAPGQVFTIEPGLYLASEGFGIRIEDDYLVTATGSEKLSAAIPCTPDDVERAMTSARGPTIAMPQP